VKGVRYRIPRDADKSSCRGCGATIYWIITESGKRMPVDPDGHSHFASCPEASRFRQDARESMQRSLL